MSEETKRGPGRPRQGKSKKQHIDITLSSETLAMLEQVTQNKSQFIEDVLRKHFEERKAQEEFGAMLRQQGRYRL